MFTGELSVVSMLLVKIFPYKLVAVKSPVTLVLANNSIIPVPAASNCKLALLSVVFMKLSCISICPVDKLSTDSVFEYTISFVVVLYCSTPSADVFLIGLTKNPETPAFNVDPDAFKIIEFAA